MTESEYSVEVGSQSPAEWSLLLDRFSDASLYQTHAFGAVSWGAARLSHLILRRAGQPVAASQLRIVRPAGLRWGVAYLRWGPLCQLRGTDLDPGVVRAMAAALHSEYVLRQRLFLRILPNALLDTTRADAFRAAFSQFRSEPFRPGQSYRTIVLDLSPPLEQLRKEFDQKWRNCLNRAERNSLTVTESDDASAFGTFLKLYEEMLARKKFTTTTDVRAFARMQAELPPSQRMKILLAEHEGAPVAGLVGTGIGESGIYLHGATNDRGMKLNGAYLLQWRMIQWLKASGVRYYNLGGINPVTNPGVYHFKCGLSGQDVLYQPPFTACENPLSRVFVAAGEFAQNGWQHLLRRRSLPPTPPPQGGDSVPKRESGGNPGNGRKGIGPSPARVEKAALDLTSSPPPPSSPGA